MCLYSTILQATESERLVGLSRPLGNPLVNVLKDANPGAPANQNGPVMAVVNALERSKCRFDLPSLTLEGPMPGIAAVTSGAAIKRLCSLADRVAKPNVSFGRNIGIAVHGLARATHSSSCAVVVCTCFGCRAACACAFRGATRLRATPAYSRRWLSCGRVRSQARRISVVTVAGVFRHAARHFPIAASAGVLTRLAEATGGEPSHRTLLP